MDARTSQKSPAVTYDCDPSEYTHWKFRVDGAIATVEMDVDPDSPMQAGYELKLNSYDLAVDIEFADIIQRLRFEYPEVRCVVLTSLKERVFCSGANIYMLGQSSHGWKVNFCKFTNETRNGLEDSSINGSLKFLAAVNGMCAGGGYELALACDEILLIDDRSSAVSAPEVPLLGVLPGTGGLTRLTDKRLVRRDLADVFSTSQEGVRGQRAKDWGLVDELVAPSRWQQAVAERAKALADRGRSAGASPGVRLTPLDRRIDDSGYHYRWVDAQLEPERGVATISVRAPEDAPPSDGDAMREQGADFWPLAMARELDDAILMLRTNEPEIGLWLMKTEGAPETVLAYDEALAAHAEHWFVNEVIGLLRRTLARLDVSSRSLFALIESGSAFAGTLAELAFAADRAYMLEVLSDEAASDAPTLTLGRANFGLYPMANGLSRLGSRFFGRDRALADIRSLIGSPLTGRKAEERGVVTFAVDEIDWEDDMRLAIDERVSLSPDALTGMEANLRFVGPESMWSRIFGRLSAWQNWIFIRPNAVGETGALRVFGAGTRPKFDRRRV